MQLLRIYDNFRFQFSSNFNKVNLLWYFDCYYSCSKIAFLASMSLLNAVMLVNIATITMGIVNIDIVSKTWNFIPGTQSL